MGVRVAGSNPRSLHPDLRISILGADSKWHAGQEWENGPCAVVCLTTFAYTDQVTPCVAQAMSQPTGQLCVLLNTVKHAK